jgi:hypothetical protein
MQTWIENEILLGFQKLMTLGLDRQPAADLIEGTVMAWCEAITAGRLFEQGRDAARFKASFTTLLRHCTQWPTPREFLDAMPRLATETVSPKIESAQSRIMGMKALSEIAALLGIEDKSC